MSDTNVTGCPDGGAPHAVTSEVVFRYLFVAFIVLPVLEIFLITRVAGGIGWLPTIVLVISISLAGAFLVRREGLGVIERVRSSLRSVRLPTNDLADGAMIFFASALMLTPGFLTDAIGLALLIPPIRAVLRPPVIAFFQKRLEVRASGFGQQGFGPAGFGGAAGTRFGAHDVTGRPAPADADVEDITPEPPELS